MLETVTVAEAKDDIQDLINATAESHRPILITTESNNAVLLSEEDWNALQETVHLLSISGMRESIVKEMNAPDSEFLTEEEFLTELEKEDEN
jgi:prevent-host-death family protein